MNNSSIKYFQQELIQLINNSNLPVGTVYFVLKDSLNEVEKLFNDCIIKESQSTNSETKKISVPIPQNVGFDENKEETENEGTNTDVAEHSGSTNDN